MNNQLELRLARPDEGPAITALVNAVFEVPAPWRRPMEEALPLFFAQPNIPQWAIALRGRRVVSAVGAHRFDVRSGRITFAAAHIGAVCTAEEWQGQHIASALLDLECSLLRSQGVTLAFVSGGRGLYRRAGATCLPGLHGRYTVPARAGDDMALRPLGADGMAEAVRLWELEPVTINRSSEMWRAGLRAIPDRPGWQRAAALVGQPAKAYVVLDHGGAERQAEITELAGERATALRAARHLAASLGYRELSVPVPAWDLGLGRALAEGATPVPAPALAAENEGSTYLLLDPVRSFAQITETLSPLDRDIHRHALLPTEGGFSLEGPSDVVASGDRAWACRLLFGAEGPVVSPYLPVALPWWRGLTYG